MPCHEQVTVGVARPHVWDLPELLSRRERRPSAMEERVISTSQRRYGRLPELACELVATPDKF